MKKIKLFLILFFIPLLSIGQPDQLKIDEIEFFIITNQIDSISNENINQVNPIYKKIIEKINQKKKLSWAENALLLYRIEDNPKISLKQIVDFFKNYTFIPKEHKLDLNYIKFNHALTTYILDYGNFKLSYQLQNEAEKYLSKFDINTNDYQKAKILLDSYEITIAIIKDDSSIQKKIIQNEKIALRLKDTNLIVLSKYQKCQTYVHQRKLIPYIQESLLCYNLEKDRINKSLYFFPNLSNLISSLLFKDGTNEQTISLLNTYYNSEQKLKSYTLFAKSLVYSPKNSEYALNIFEQFEVGDIEEFCSKIKKSTKGRLSHTDYQSLIDNCSQALFNYGEYDLFSSYNDELIHTIRSIYSNKLSNDLAEFKTSILEKEKEKELAERDSKINTEKRKNQLFMLIAFISVGMVLLGLLFFIRLRKQKKKISTQKNKLEKSDHEKSILLKEINHRVKNNFQIICSLFELQSKGIEDKKTLEIINDGQNRVKSMALIHQKLYENDDLTILLSEYINQLYKDIHSIYPEFNVTTELKLNKSLSFDIDTAIPLGLILNELITNAFKHAMNKREKNQLFFSVEKLESQYLMIVKDSGAGISSEIDLKKTKSIGLRLIRRLSKQLQGKMEYTYDNGSVFRIYFKDTLTRNNID